jgi:hypothetical protein
LGQTLRMRRSMLPEAHGYLQPAGLQAAATVLSRVLRCIRCHVVPPDHAVERRAVFKRCTALTAALNFQSPGTAAAAARAEPTAVPAHLRGFLIDRAVLGLRCDASWHEVKFLCPPQHCHHQSRRHQQRQNQARHTCTKSTHRCKRQLNLVGLQAAMR